MNQTAQKGDERYDVTTHFGFGENWAEYAQHITPLEIAQAEEGLNRLVPAEALKDKTFLDIGCGSGLHGLAALKQGAAQVTCVDIDPSSVATAQAVLQAHASPGTQSNYTVLSYNILHNAITGREGVRSTESGCEWGDDTQQDGNLSGQQFDIVYSWGVLHHTGDMWPAIERAADFVKPGGVFVIALYKKTPLCGFWRMEKFLYSRLSKFLRPLMHYPYAAFYLTALALTGTNPVRYVRDYNQDRGMHFMTDIIDWLGGYPYESASAEEVKTFLETRGFALEKALNTQKMKAAGLFGSGCAEYVFRRQD